MYLRIVPQTCTRIADNQFDFVVSGDYVRNLKLNNGTNIFKLTDPGSL
ncbi:MAG TPA: hypothetical protein PKM50_08210 [Methanoregula sp.]|nr:hypothetical protein [Methanoregula sp.]